MTKTLQGMNNIYNLQLRHGAETQNFSTRDEVAAYIQGQLKYGGVSLLPYEPVLFFYGEENDKNAIILVGLPEGQKQGEKSYFLIDTTDLQEQIDGMDGKAKEAIEALQQEDVKIWDAVNEEIAERIEMDAVLSNTDDKIQEDVELLKNDLMGIIEACGLIYNEKIIGDKVSYQPDLHDEVIRDSKNIAEAVDKISKFAFNLGQNLKVNVDSTDTVTLKMEENTKNGGSVITADVNIAGVDGLSRKTFDNNIIGKTSEGLYSSVSLEPSLTDPNKLIFKTSGYINGQFKVDAFETEVDITAYKGDNGKETGVNVEVDTNKNIISAQLNLSSNKKNILKLEDGEYIVEGIAKNIKFGDSTVAQTLREQNKRIEEIEETIIDVRGIDIKGGETETSITTVEKNIKGDYTITNGVKLSNDHSIIVANGGLKANVSASYKSGTSTLIINVGDNTYSIDLSELAVSILESAEYDTSNEEIVLTFRVGDKFKTLRIPVDKLIHDVEVEDTDTINLKLKSVSGGPNVISAELRVDKAHSDNILTVNSNGAYVSKAFITDAIKEESDARKESETEIKTKLETVSTVADTNKENLVNEANIARAAEKANADAIAENTNTINGEIERAKLAEQSLYTSISVEIERANTAEKVNSTAINEEVIRAKGVESDLLSKITEEIVRANGEENNIKLLISNETERAIEKENDIFDKVNVLETNLTTEVNKKANSVNVYTKEEILTKLDDYAKDTDVQSKLDEKLNITDAKNVYATKESVQEVKDSYASKEYVDGVSEQIDNRVSSNTNSISNFNLTYNAATSELIYTDKNGTNHTYKLYSGSLIKKGEFDPKTNSIILTIENVGVESQIVIPVSELLSDLSEKINENATEIQKINEALGAFAKQWETNTSSSIELTKTTVGEKDTLTANVRVASSNKQAIQATGDGLYVSNDLEDYTCVFGSEGTISGQTAISKLLESTNSFDGRITANTNEIENLKGVVDSYKTDIVNVKERMSTIEQKNVAIETKVNTLETKVNGFDNRIISIEENMTKLTNEFSEIKELIKEIEQGEVGQLILEVARIKQVLNYDEYDVEAKGDVPSRIDKLEEKTENLVDAGTF